VQAPESVTCRGGSTGFVVQRTGIYSSQPQLRTYTTITRSRPFTPSSPKSAKSKGKLPYSRHPPDYILLSPSEQDELFDLVSSIPLPSTTPSPSTSKPTPKAKPKSATGTAEEHKADILQAELEGEYEAAFRYYSGSEYNFGPFLPNSSSSPWPPAYSSPGAGPSRLGSSSGSTRPATSSWASRPAPSTSTSKLTSTSPKYAIYKRRIRDKILPGPPDNSRQTLWDWRLWFSRRKGAVARGLTGPKPQEPETEDAVELSSNGKVKRKKEKAKERQMNVRRKRLDVLPLEEGDAWYEEAEEYKKQCVPTSLLHL
jgi:hypothetical protein